MRALVVAAMLAAAGASLLWAVLAPVPPPQAQTLGQPGAPARSAPEGEPLRPEESLLARRGLMVLADWHFRTLKTQEAGSAAEERAQALANLALMMPDSFHTPTPDLPDNRTRPTAWDDPQAFEKALVNFQTETAQLAYILRTGNQAARRTQVGRVAASCKGCHDRFREKE